MQNIAVSQLREKLPAFLKQVQNGETIIVMSRGNEVARLVPPVNESQKARAALKKLRKKCHVGDVLTPLNVDWKALK